YIFSQSIFLVGQIGGCEKISQEVKVVKEKILIRDIVAAVIALLLIFLNAYTTQVMAMAKYWVFQGAWIPFIWFVLIVAVVGRLSPRLRMNKTFCTLILIFLFINTGKSYFAGLPETNWISTLAGSFQAAVAAPHFPKGAMDILGGLVPEWFLPRDYDATARYYYGGGEPIWGPLTGAIITWALILIAIFLISLPMIFLIFGPQWWETERLLFPITIPTVYAVNETYTEEPDKWGRLLRFKENKVFWVCFIIGLVLNAPTILQQIIPAIPFGELIAGGGYGHYRILFTSYFPVLNDLLPGAEINVAFMIDIVLIFILLPLDFTITFLLFRVLFGFVYNVSAIRLGLVPPGRSPSTFGPFPHTWIFGQGGAIIGFAIYVLWMARDKIKRAFSCFLRDFEVDGISMRYGMSIMTIGTIMLLGILVVAGMNPLTAILWFIIATLANISGTRIAAEVATYWIGWHGTYGWQLIHPIGVSLGLWGYPPQRNTSLAMMGLAHGLISGNPGPYANNGALQQSMLALAYGVAKGTRSDIRKIFNLILISVIIFVPFSLIFDVWFMSHVGLSNTGAGAMVVFPFNTISNSGLNTGIEATTWGVTRTPAESWTWAIVGSIIIFAVGYLRSIFPWFFIHPLGLVLAGMHPYWIGWLNPLVALIIKLILLRTIGARRLSEIIIPFLAGISAGFAFLYVFLALYGFFTISWSNLTLLWK
ncbi:MAG: DUF6785 family protein, partial [Candidatus Bathyarchaeia archaeon]